MSIQLAEVRERGEQAIRRDVLIKEYKLSDRQAKALGHILERGSLNIKDFEGICPKVNRRTLQRDLKAMIDKGLIFEKATSPTDPTKHYLIKNKQITIVRPRGSRQVTEIQNSKPYNREEGQRN